MLLFSFGRYVPKILIDGEWFARAWEESKAVYKVPFHFEFSGNPSVAAGTREADTCFIIQGILRLFLLYIKCVAFLFFVGFFLFVHKPNWLLLFAVLSFHQIWIIITYDYMVTMKRKGKKKNCSVRLIYRCSFLRTMYLITFV